MLVLLVSFDRGWERKSKRTKNTFDDLLFGLGHSDFQQTTIRHEAISSYHVAFFSTSVSFAMIDDVPVLQSFS